MGMEGMLPDTCTIQVRAQIGVDQETREPLFAWTDEQTDVECMFQDMDGGIMLTESGEYVKLAARLFLPASATITANTRRVITTAIGFEGSWIVKHASPKKDFDGAVDHYEVLVMPDTTAPSTRRVLVQGGAACMTYIEIEA